MGLYQSYRQVFVTNAPNLLAQGKTVDSLAVGQIGIIDAKTNTAVTAPTYATTKAFKFVWGTPDVNLGDFGGVPNENEYTKLIKGKLIKGFRAKKAKRGQTPLYTIGWSGDAADTDTLFAKKGQSKSVFVKLTGTVIDRLYDKQGFTKELVTVPACVDDCDDTCADILCPDLATQLADQINTDKDLSKFIKAKAIVSCDGVAAPTEGTVYKFKLDVADAGDQTAFGAVQAQYPNDKITINDRVGIVTTYGTTETTNTAPADYVGSNTVVPDCGACPTGYTYQPLSNQFTVKITTGDTYPTLAGEISHTKTGTNVSGMDVYTSYVDQSVSQSTFETEVTTANAAYTATFVASVKEACIQTAPVTISWVADGTLKTRTQDYHITLADSVCGTNRLADLQAAYPDLTVTVVNSAGSCVHTYSVTLTSNPYVGGCAVESITYPTIPMFEGAEWVAVPAAALDPATVCHCGVQIETSFFNRKTNECTFDAFPFENDVVHVQISNYNPDFNGSPCEGDWVVKQLRQVQYPQGHGGYIQHLEKESKQYDLHYRAYDPVVREIQGFSLQADATKFYDQYTLIFDTKFYTSGGWSETTTETFSLDIFVPEGTGTPIETAINGYLASAGIDEDGAVV